MENTSEVTEDSMKASEKIIKCMGLEGFHGLIMMFMKESSKMIREKDLES